MLTRIGSALRTAAAATFLLALAMPAAAQNTQTDGRWQAWLSCWSPAGTLVRVIGRSPTPVVCVVPGSTASAVDILTVSGGKVVDRMTVDADGQPHAITKEGCKGSQTATWSPSARRLYLKSEYNCSGAPATHVSGLYAMAGVGEWIDVQGMRVDKNSGVHAVRYREAADPGPLPEEITKKLHEQGMSRMAAMLAVTEPPSLQDVEEASHQLDPNVVSTWLIQADKVALQKPAPISAAELEQLADHDVPASVTDVMIGLSYPDVFAVNPTGGGVARQNTDSAYARYGYAESMNSMSPIIGFDRLGFPIYASDASLMYGCSPYQYAPYNAAYYLYASQFACGGYGYSGFGGYGGYGYYGGYPYGGYPYGGYYGGYPYFGGGPVVVPVPSGTSGSPAPTHGRVVRGRGYVQGGSSSGGTASPSGNNSSSNSGGSGASASSSPPPPPPPPERTAVPKKP